MAIPAQLQKRLDLLMVDEQTKSSLSKVIPFLDEEIDLITDNFYSHITSYSETEKIFKSRTQIAALKYNQKKHWMALFACSFDEKYVTSAMRIGQVHFQQKVAPYLYIAGYNFFHCAVIGVVTKRQTLSKDLSDVLPAIAKVINLDMDLSLTVYTREYWRRMANEKSLEWTVD